MLSDFEIMDLYFGGGLPSDQAFSAWQRIKDKLTAEALKPSHNKQSAPLELDCTHHEWYQGQCIHCHKQAVVH